MLESMFDDQTTSRWIPRNKLGLPVHGYSQASAVEFEPDWDEWAPAEPRFARPANPHHRQAVVPEQPTMRRWPAHQPQPTAAQFTQDTVPAQVLVERTPQPRRAQPTLRAVVPPPVVTAEHRATPQARTLRGVQFVPPAVVSSPLDLAIDMARLR